MWQHHGDVPGFVGRCDGVSTSVDLNDCYKDYPQIIKDHLLNNWTRTDLDAAIKPETEKNPVTTISFLDAAKLLKQAGYTSITL